MTAEFMFDVAPLGRFVVRRVIPTADIDLIYRWVGGERARFWGMTALSRAEVLETYQHIDSLPSHHAFLVRWRDAEVGLLQSYEPTQDPLGEHYDAQPSDVGIHLLSAPADGAPVQGLTDALLATLVALVLRDREKGRVVCEPDAQNTKMLTLLRRNGFQLGPLLTMPHKTARLTTLDRPGGR